METVVEETKDTKLKDRAEEIEISSTPKGTTEINEILLTPKKSTKKYEEKSDAVNEDDTLKDETEEIKMPSTSKVRTMTCNESHTSPKPVKTTVNKGVTKNKDDKLNRKTKNNLMLDKEYLKIDKNFSNLEKDDEEKGSEASGSILIGMHSFTSTFDEDDKENQTKALKKIEKLILEQSDTLEKINCIEDQVTKKRLNKNTVDDDTDDFVWEDSFPLATDEQIQILEDKINSRVEKQKLKRYLKDLAGSNAISLTNNILKHCMADELAKGYSFKGKTKKNFASLHLTKCIRSAVRERYPDTTFKTIDSKIGSWLALSSNRISAMRAALLSEQKLTVLCPVLFLNSYLDVSVMALISAWKTVA
ncbi:hypothetical protein TSAR_005111 [Trichomalopsis sarcophagae]|uniref:DUF4806 domain-containing protein n=1 Tax=Trichomalopsis sarcophagae TaxID=543379 RepID=A0A232F3R1_9HYME|nr:hypothetical protein TSAR_005111 [Trichomalopsis sarcophagae]